MASVLTKKQKKDKQTLSDLKAIGSQLLSSRSHINYLPLLLSFVSRYSPPQQALEALLSLQAFFTPLLPLLPPSFSSSAIPENSSAQDDPDFIYRTWLRAKFDDLISSLIDICISHQSDEALREVALDTLMEFVKVGNGGRFHSAIYHRLMQNIVHSSMAVEALLDFLATKYFKYIDVRYFAYISVEKLARTLETKDISDGDHNTYSRASLDLSIRKVYHILSHITPLEGMDEKADYEMWNGLGVFVKEGDHKEQPGHRKGTDELQKSESSSKNVLSAVAIGKKSKAKFTKAWISFLRLPFPLDVYKEVLVTLQKAVVPHLSNPVLLCDFLTRSYDIGGVISVMALSSLYVLMTQHGIEYPNFYEKLYGLLLPSILMAKHRAKFFELLDSCLKSPLLPAYLAAAFAKKLSRLSLSVPPSGALVIIALIHNLLRRHPSTNFLVHRESADGAAKDDDGEDGITSNEPGIDCFNNDESNPIKTKAMRSSLWEIDALRHHYCPPVSRFVLSLENDLTVKSKTTELAVNDFSSGSYATVFREEIGRRVKQVPLAFYKATPGYLFCESDFAGWTFNHESTTCSDEHWSVDSSEGHDKKRQRIKCS